jgi:hypothetical protein
VGGVSGKENKAGGTVSLIPGAILSFGGCLDSTSKLGEELGHNGNSPPLLEKHRLDASVEVVSEAVETSAGKHSFEDCCGFSSELDEELGHDKTSGRA